MGRFMKIAVFLVLVMVTVGAASAQTVLRYATIAEPPSLDQQVLTSDQATTIAQHVFEGLYTFNKSYDPVPMLVDKESISADGKTVTLTLRQGVKFHNGKEMTSEDVLSSLNRWGVHGTRGPVLFANIEKVEAPSKYSIRIIFKNAFAPWKALLAFINGGPVIYPKEIADVAGKPPITEAQYIGTGPYTFVERNPGRYIELAKFAGYSARSDKPDGYAGKRTAMFDKIRFIPVSDVGTRVNGVKAGDYDYAEQISGDLYDMLSSDKSVVTLVNEGVIQPLMFFNSNEGPFVGNYKLRQAILAVLDMTGALQAAVGPKNLWSTNAAIMPKATSWYTMAGTDLYNKKSVAMAKSLAAEAGYKGEKIIFMVSSAYKIHNDIGLVFTKNMKDAGFNVDLQVYDWATLVSKRGDPKQWHIFFTHHGFVPDPVLYSFMSDTYPGWWATPEKQALAKTFTSTVDEKKRLASWSEFQKLIFVQIPVIKIGDVFTYDVYSPKLKGLGETQLIWPKFWDVSFK
jgi:peptide/nickel transport system substrate-binding protein